MEVKNATYLFERPWRLFHNSESFWTSWFALFLLQQSSSEGLKELPVRYCDPEEHFPGKARSTSRGCA